MIVKNRRVKIGLIIALIVITAFCVSAVGFIAYLSPPKDKVSVFNYPPKFFCGTIENHIDYQTDGKCAAYASAYLLRNFGEEVDGEGLYLEFKRQFGFVSANGIVNVFKRHGHRAKAYHGGIDTLKQRLTDGQPIIVFIRILNDTHYAVVVGYDEQYIYLVDSLEENANALDTRYNRVIKTKEFESVWKNGTILPDNIYIVVKI